MAIPPPPGMPSMPPSRFPPPPPGMPSSLPQNNAKMPPENLAQKSQKWIQMQKKRYGEKRKGGYVDMGKQVRPSTSFPDHF
jgi:pre-mRNA-processing factor 8